MVRKKKVIDQEHTSYRLVVAIMFRAATIAIAHLFVFVIVVIRPAGTAAPAA